MATRVPPARGWKNPDGDGMIWGLFPTSSLNLTRIIHACSGEHLLAGLGEKEGDTTKGALVRLTAARTRGAHACVICQVLSP